MMRIWTCWMIADAVAECIFLNSLAIAAKIGSDSSTTQNQYFRTMDIH